MSHDDQKIITAMPNDEKKKELDLLRKVLYYEVLIMLQQSV